MLFGLWDDIQKASNDAEQEQTGNELFLQRVIAACTASGDMKHVRKNQTCFYINKPETCVNFHLLAQWLSKSYCKSDSQLLE